MRLISVTFRNLRKPSAVSLLALTLWGASMHIVAADSQISEILDNTIDVIELFAILVWMLTLVVFGWGIVRFIASAGNQEKLKQSKGILWAGVIGLFVLSTIVGIIVYIQNYLGIEGVQIIRAPQF